jgi:hypothetical protein
MSINTFIPQEITRAIHTKNDGATNWYTNQVQDFSIQVDGNEQTKEDANGNVIATITRGKSCTVSFSTPVYDINIIAAMNGTSKQIASEENKLVTTAFEEFEISASQTTVVLKNNAINGTISVTTLSKDGSADRIFKVGAATAAGTVTYTDVSKTITFETDDITAGETVLVKYEYETTNAVGMTASAKDFPEAGRLYVEVKGFDVCDQSTAIYAYYRFPTAKIQSSYETPIGLDSTYTITMDCAVDYCDKDKQFYSLVIPGVS